MHKQTTFLPVLVVVFVVLFCLGGGEIKSLFLEPNFFQGSRRDETNSCDLVRYPAWYTEMRGWVKTSFYRNGYPKINN